MLQQLYLNPYSVLCSIYIYMTLVTKRKIVDIFNSDPPPPISYPVVQSFHLLRVPVHHPRPYIKLGPCSSTVRKQQATDTGNDDDDDYSSCSLALYLLIDNLLSLYCPMTGKLLLSIDLKCVVSDPSHCPLGCLEPFWLIFTNAQGLALKSERGGKWIVSDVSSAAAIYTPWWCLYPEI